MTVFDESRGIIGFAGGDLLCSTFDGTYYIPVDPTVVIPEELSEKDKDKTDYEEVLKEKPPPGKEPYSNFMPYSMNVTTIIPEEKPSIDIPLPYVIGAIIVIIILLIVIIWYRRRVNQLERVEKEIFGDKTREEIGITNLREMAWKSNEP